MRKMLLLGLNYTERVQTMNAGEQQARMHLKVPLVFLLLVQSSGAQSPVDRPLAVVTCLSTQKGKRSTGDLPDNA